MIRAGHRGSRVVTDAGIGPCRGAVEVASGDDRTGFCAGVASVEKPATGGHVCLDRRPRQRTVSALRVVVRSVDSVECPTMRVYAVLALQRPATSPSPRLGA